MYCFAALPTGDVGWVYFAVCAAFFAVCGLICGFFIWRKGHMQTIEAELEVKKVSEELEQLREDLRIEEKEIRPEDSRLVIDEE